MKQVDEELLNEIANAYVVQKDQRNKVDERLAKLNSAMENLSSINSGNNDELDKLLSQAMCLSETMGINVNANDEQVDEIAEQMIELTDEEKASIEVPYYESIDTVDVSDDWNSYINKINLYAEKNSIDLSVDPFYNLLTETERNEIGQRIRDDYLLKEAHCDKYDYIIAAFCGVVCGLVDSFFVKMPSTKKEENSKLGQWADKKADEFVENISKKLWDADSKKRDYIKDLYKNKQISLEQRNKMLKDAGIPYNQNINSAPDGLQQCIQYLEKKFGVNYDASTAAGLKTNDALGSMTPSNHHLKSLAHSPSIIGLIFSIIDQFTGKGTFVDDGKLVRIAPVDKKNGIDQFELRGSNFPAKIICGVCNWLGHLCSDLVGSNTTRAEEKGGRGSGLPAPFMEIMQMCNFSLPDKDGKKMTAAQLTVKMFESGYDARFAVATAIPVLLNEFLIRLMWCLKSRFYHNRTWKESIPVGQKPELRRMLLVGHGVLCVVDAIDAGIRSSDLLTFSLHLNVAAWSRLAIAGIQEVRAMYKQNVADVVAMEDDLEREWNMLYKQVVV